MTGILSKSVSSVREFALGSGYSQWANKFTNLNRFLRIELVRIHCTTLEAIPSAAQHSVWLL